MPMAVYCAKTTPTAGFLKGCIQHPLALQGDYLNHLVKVFDWPNLVGDPAQGRNYNCRESTGRTLQG